MSRGGKFMTNRPSKTQGKIVNYVLYNKNTNTPTIQLITVYCKPIMIYIYVHICIHTYIYTHHICILLVLSLRDLWLTAKFTDSSSDPPGGPKPLSLADRD